MDFTDQQLDQIAARNNRKIENREAFRRYCLRDSQLPPHERRYDYTMIAETKTAPATETATAPPEAPQAGIAVYEKPQDFMGAIEKLGKWFYDSKMMGCNMPAQGQVLALACMTMKLSPFDIIQRYDIIGGKLNPKSAWVVAEFQRLGGDVGIVQRDEHGTVVDLTWKAKTTRFSFTWEDAQQEPFVFEKDKKTPKTNYATPRARMQMLWARCVSDGIRTICPQVNSGLYTPEEMGEEPIEADYSVVASPAASMTPQPTNRPLDRSTGGVSACAAEVHAQQQAAAATTKQSQSAASSGSTMPSKEQGSAPAAGTDSVKGEAITRDQLLRVKDIKDLLEREHIDPQWKSGEKWKAILAKLGVTKAGELDVAGGERLLAWLKKQKDTLPPSPAKDAVDQRDALDKWADGALMPGGAGGAPGK